MCQAGQTGGGRQRTAEPLTMYRVAPEPRITQSREAGKPAIKGFFVVVACCRQTFWAYSSQKKWHEGLLIIMKVQPIT